MSWKKRSGKAVIPKGRWAPEYGPDSENFTIALHHHGKFNKNKTRYNNGVVDYFDGCCADEMSLLEVKSMASLCGIYGDEFCYYLSKHGIKSCRELVKMVNDTDTCNMSLYVDASDSVGVYVAERDSDEIDSTQEDADNVEVNEENLDEVADDQVPLTVEEYESMVIDQNVAEDNRRGPEIDSELHELNELFQRLMDERDTTVPDENQSIGSDSVNSDRDRMVDSDCDVENEDPDFYKNVQVQTNLGGLYNTNIMLDPSVKLPTKKASSSRSKPKTYEGFRVFDPKTDMDDPVFEHGMLFEGPEVFRAAIRKHSVLHGKQLKYGKNERTRIGLTCTAKKCPWEIYVASYKNHGPHTLQVRTLFGDHKCRRVNKLTTADSNWMAETHGDLIQTIKKWDVRSMQAVAWKKNNVKVSKYQMYRARNKVQSKTNGTVDEQYALIFPYAAEIIRSDPTNNVKIKPLKKDDGKELFKRIYICWGAIKKGFAEGLRKFICMDGCHLKTKNGGVLLTAIGIDPNNNMYPIAYAIVEKETTDTWRWFLEYLKGDLNIPDKGEGWTFMSDKQKGLINAVDHLFKEAEHRFCVVHLYKNFKLSHSGLALQKLVWKAAKSTRVLDFENTLVEIREKDVNACAWLAQKPAVNWSKAFFSTLAKTDVCVNNFSESLNALIKESRSKPIIEFLEDLRVLFMKRIWVNHQQMSTWWGTLCPNIAETLELQEFKSASFQCLFNGEDEFEVYYISGGKDCWQVNLTDRTCSCRKWQLTGIPCAHAICGLKFLGLNEVDYVDPCYTKSMYMKVYSHCMHILRGRSEWPHSNRKLLPPLLEKMPGRPKKYHRKKSAQEIQDQKARLAIKKAKETGHLGHHGMLMTCTHCSTPGHNKRGCLKRKAEEASKAGTEAAKLSDKAIGVKRSKNVVLNTEEAIQDAITASKSKLKEKILKKNSTRQQGKVQYKGKF